MDTFNNSINTIKIFADAKNFDSPRDSTTESLIKFRQGDYVVVDVVLQTNNKLADLTNIVSVNLEILDIGSINMPSPRDVKLLIQQTIQTDDINKNLTDEDVENGNVHVSFKLDKSNTSIESSDKWLKIYTYDSSGNRTTFSQGWIFVEESLGDDIISETVENDYYLSKIEADSKYFLKDSNLNDSLDVSEIRNNIEVYSVDEIDSNIAIIDSSINEISTEITSLNTSIDLIDTQISETQSQLQSLDTSISSINNSIESIDSEIDTLESSISTKANSSTTLSGYGITNAYTKTEVDSSLSTLESSIESKADADTTNTSIQSLKFDKINDGYIQFGDGVTGQNWAYGSLNQTIDCNNLTFCFQAELRYGLLYLYGSPSTSTSAFGIGISSHASGISFTIGFSGTVRSFIFALSSLSTLDDAFVLTVEDVDFENETLTAKLYSSTFEGAMLPTLTTGTFPVEFQLTGFSVCSVGGNYPNVPPSPSKRTFKNLKAFNFVLPLNDDDDTDSIGYTIEDYLNGKDEPPSLRDSTATNQALVSLLNYTCTVGTTKYITNIGTGANAIEAAWVAGGYMGGSKDDEINALADYIIARS